MRFPFIAVTIDEDTMNKLRFFQSQLFVRDTPLPVPTSFLIDKNGYLAVIYRGPVEVEQLLEDIKALELPANELRHMAVPMTGRWSSPPARANVPELAKVLQDAGLLADAIRMLDHYIRTAQRQGHDDTGSMRPYAEAFNNFGIALLKQGAFKEAEHYLQLAITARPNSSMAYQNLANLYIRTNQYPKAVTAYLSSLNIDPNNAVMHNDLGHLLDNMQQHDRAADQYRAAIKADAKFPNAHTNLGIYYANRKQMDKAIESFQAAVDLQPANLQFLNNLTTAYMQVGKENKAREVVEKAVAQADEQTARQIIKSFGKMAPQAPDP